MNSEEEEKEEGEDEEEDVWKTRKMRERAVEALRAAKRRCFLLRQHRQGVG